MAPRERKIPPGIVDYRHRDPDQERLEKPQREAAMSKTVAVVMLFVVLALMLFVSVALSAQESVSLGQVRSIHIAGMQEMLGPDRQIASCFIDKMKDQGPFTFPDTPETADVVMTLTSKIPSGSARTLWGRSPEVKATLATKSGRAVWSGENKYKKSTTVWGASTDIPCGLANGLVNKLVKDIQKAR